MSSESKAPKADDLTIETRDGGKKEIRADLELVVTNIQLDYAVGSASQLTLSVVDPRGTLMKRNVAALGSVVRLGNEGPWEIGAIEQVFAPTGFGDDQSASGVMWEFRCRTTLARKLRKTIKVTSDRDVSPGDWMARAVKQAGKEYECHVLHSSKKSTITQGPRQTELEIITSLCSDIGWNWVEHSNMFFAGSPWDALHSKFNKAGVKPKDQLLPAYVVTWERAEETDALEMNVSLSDDDTDYTGTGELLLPYKAGKNIRPWNTIRLDKVGAVSGWWLVESVSYSRDGVSPVTVNISRPKRPKKKKGSG